MAKLFPELNLINNFIVKPTPGELKLLTFLHTCLDDSYEVYFQPFLNGDNPDIIILRENSGAMIIEVKDWQLDYYRLSPKKHWQLKNVRNNLGNLQIVKSPIQQVFEYKENLYNLHIESLLEKRIKNPKYLSVVTCVVYFHNATKSDLDSFLTNDFKEDINYLKYLSHFELMGFDSLNEINFKSIMYKRWMDRQSYLFDEGLYKSFKRYLVPPLHTVEQGTRIIYTDEQERVIDSRPKKEQKIKGVAGSGKTLTLAKRAVNAHLRHKGEVLILTFNISLRNYIHDKISEVRENFAWKHFTILHYHQFIKAHNNNIGFVKTLPDEDMRAGGKTYETIIVDEIQDYEENWVRNIKSLLSPSGEYVVFGDEKQNIYQRKLEDRKPFTGIGGQWNILKKSFRVTIDIGNLATAFQKYFFTEKYEFDEIIFQRSLFDMSLIHYHNLNVPDIDQILNIYQETITKNSIHDNDICLQACKVEILRSVDQQIRVSKHQRTNTMFETAEVYEKLKVQMTDLNGNIDSKKLKKELDVIRRNKKFNFWMNSGTVKLSTIHSFKGWEVPTLFLIIEPEELENTGDFTSDELIYTAITRCRQNLIIINLGNAKYDQFFKIAVKK